MNFAVIKSGGKQYLVNPGAVIVTEKIAEEAEKELSFTPLLVFDEKGESIDIGKPETKKTVSAKILSHGRGEKVSIVKFKRKVRYRRHRGHRQDYTKIQFSKI